VCVWTAEVRLSVGYMTVRVCWRAAATVSDSLGVTDAARTSSVRVLARRLQFVTA
jgi:hypothetical protein